MRGETYYDEERTLLVKSLEKEEPMKKGVVMVMVMVMVVVLAGCGFVVEDTTGETVDYERLASTLPVMPVGGDVSYGLSTPGVSEKSPQVYHTPWGKTYLFFVRDSILYAAEVLPDGFGPPRGIYTNESGYSLTRCTVFDGADGKVYVGLDYFFYELTSTLSLGSYTGNSSSPVSPVVVWNGTTWETWAMGRNYGQSGAVLVRYDADGSYTPVVPDSDVANLLYDRFGGVGVIGAGETNFVLLRVCDNQGETFFQQVVIRMRQGNLQWETNLIYRGLTGVYTPSIDPQGGYTVYFAMKEPDPSWTSYDLYRFRYLTWDRMIPRDIRAKLP